jgi:hypothetical protein
MVDSDGRARTRSHRKEGGRDGASEIEGNRPEKLPTCRRLVLFMVARQKEEWRGPLALALGERGGVGANTARDAWQEKGGPASAAMQVQRRRPAVVAVLSLGHGRLKGGLGCVGHYGPCGVGWPERTVLLFNCSKTFRMEMD